MSTLANLIEETREHLLAGDRDQINTLASSIGTSDTSLTFTYVLDQIQPGAEISIDLETMYIWATSEGGRTATVLRGYKGTLSTAHNSGDIVYVNPKFSGYKIAQQINAEIRDLGAPPNGLWRVKNYVQTTFPVRKTYSVPALNTDMYYILDVRYHEPGAEFLWIRMKRWDYQVLRGMPIDATDNDGFANGMAVRIDKPMYPGRPLDIVYATGFTELANLTDDPVAVGGLPSTALDIPPLGAAARLMGVREGKRAFVESEVDTRRAGEVPVGAATKAAETLISLLNERIRTELSRLQQQWPDRR
jgi:hypothetical protein